MKEWAKFIFLLIIIAIIFYCIGMFFPIINRTPLIAKCTNEMSCYEHYNLIINTILAISSMLAIIVALMKEEIVSLWRKPSLFILQDSNDSLLHEHLQSNSNNSSPSADCYDVLITLKNKGKADAKNIRIQLSEAIFINHQTNNKSSIILTKKTIEIEEAQSLSRHSSIDIKIASLINKQEPQEKLGKDGVYEIIYLIGDNEIKADYHIGEIQLSIIVSCDGGYGLKRKISLKWDKKWYDRLVDICPDHLTATMLKGDD